MIQPKLHVDLSWLNKLSYNWERFSKVKNELFTCRCPICGDSTKNKKKTRFFAYVKKGKLLTYCHNCGYSKSFYMFVKEIYPHVFNEYRSETLFDSFRSSTFKDKGVVDTLAPVIQNNALQSDSGLLYSDFIKSCTRITELDKEHPAKRYLIDRGFTIREYKDLFYTEDFKHTASLVNVESTEKLQKEPRIVIPFITPDGVVEMLQGRSLDPDNKLRYVSIKANDDVKKIFGRYGLDETSVVRCVEGPLDSLFVDNCIATCDGNLNRSDADVLIWDIQPRNAQIIKYMDQAIESGRSLVIWPMIPDKKIDINDLIKKGVSRKQLIDMIDKHTYHGLTAKLNFMKWKRQ